MSKSTQFIIVFGIMFIAIGYSQELPLKVEMSVARQEIHFRDQVDVLFELTNLYPTEKEFFVMLPEAERGSYDVLGHNRWRIILAPKERKQLSFTVTPKFPHDFMVITLGIGFRGFQIDYATSVKVKIVNAQYVRKDIEKKKDDILPMEGGGISVQSEGIIMIDSIEAIYPGDDKVFYYPSLNLSDEKPLSSMTQCHKRILKKKDRIHKEFGEENPHQVEFQEEVDFVVDGTITYENASNFEVPIEYCAVYAFGLQSQNEPPQDWDLLWKYHVFPSDNGLYAFFVPSGYPWYRVGIALDAKANSGTSRGIYSFWVGPDNWDGTSSAQFFSPIYISVPFQPPIQSVPFNAYFSESQVPLFRRASVLFENIHDAYEFAEPQPGPIDSVAIVYNHLNTHGRNYFAPEFFVNNPISAIVFDGATWLQRRICLHEYGHNVMFSFEGLQPEAGGQHRLGRRSNPQVAYTEGWAHFFSAIVPPENSDIGIFNLANTPPTQYNDPFAVYAPETPHWGVEDESRIAAAFWEFKQSIGITNVWNGARDYVNVTGHFAWNFLEFLRKLQENNVTIPSSFWSRAVQMNLGDGIQFVTGGTGLQTALNNSTNKGLVYVFNGMYNGNIEIKDAKSLGLFGERPDQTILIGNGTGNLIYIKSTAGNDYTQIDGFTIQSGNLGIDAAKPVYVSNNFVQMNKHGVCGFDNIVIRNNVIIANADNGLGSGILIPEGFSSNAQAWIYNNHFENNDISINLRNNNTFPAQIYNNLIYNNEIGVRSIINNDGLIDLSNNAFFANQTNFVNVTPDNNNIFNDPQFDPDPSLYQVPTHSNYPDGGFGTPPTVIDFEDRSKIGRYSNSNSYKNFISLYGGPEAFWIGSQILTDAFTIEVSGTIAENTSWCSEIIVTGDVTIESGVTLTIFPGTIVKFYPDVQLLVKGSIEAQGTSASPIIFTSIYSNPTTSQYWDWIKIDGSQDTDPAPQRIFDNVTIEYADYGIHATQVSDLTIENSVIQNCQLNNIYLYNSYGYFDNNSINNAGISNGVYLYNSSPLFYNTTINDNTGAGVFCYNYSSPEFGASTSTAYGLNVLAGNAYGVSAFYYSNPFLGDEYDIEGPVRYGGYNSIYDNSSAAIKAEKSCDVIAQYNWWGRYPVDPEIFDIEEGCTIDYDHALTYDPNQESSTLTAGGSVSERSGHSSLPTENFTPRQLLKLGKKLRVQRLPRLALPVYKQLIHNYPNRVEAQWGLIELISTFKEAGRDSAVAYLLHTIVTHPNLQMQRVAFDMLTGEYLKKRNANAAVSNAQQILTNYSDTESEKIALFDLINIYFHNLNNPSQAQTYLSQLENKYPNDELTLHAQMLLSSGSSTMAKGGEFNSFENTAKQSVKIPATFDLIQNYPNPFNPVTTIAFSLPRSQEVQLTIYSISGQEIIILVDEFMEKGYHQVKWNGKDASGRQVASGIYLYRLETGGKNIVKKMMLIK